jgi:hypothetical protein
VRNEVEEQARGKERQGRSNRSSSMVLAAAAAAAVLVAIEATAATAAAAAQRAASTEQQQQTEHAKPAGALHKRQTSSPSLAAAFYRAFRCASPRSTHVGPRTQAPVRQYWWAPASSRHHQHASSKQQEDSRQLRLVRPAKRHAGE